MQRNPFCSNLRAVNQALTTDKNLKMSWEKLPPGAGAGFSFYDNKIIMPAVNTITIDENDAKKLNAFSYHERLHYVCSTSKELEESIILDNPKLEKELRECFDKMRSAKSSRAAKTPKDTKQGMHKTLSNYLEDCRIEMNTNYRLPGDLEDLLWFRSVSADEMELKHEEWLTANPWGMIMQTLQYNICNYRTFTIDETKFPEQRKMYDIAWKILNDGRFHKSCTKMKDGAPVILDLTKEIIEAWKEEANRDISEEMEDGEGETINVSGPSEDSEQKEAKDSQDGDGQLFNEKETIKIKKKEKKDKEEGKEKDGKEEGKEKDGDKEGEKDGKGKGKSEDGKDGEGKEGKGEKDDSKDGEEKDGKSGTIESEKVVKDGIRDIEAEFEIDQSKLDGRYKINPEQLKEDMEELSEESLGEQERPSGGGLQCNPFMKEVLKVPYVPYEVYDRILIPKLFPQNYEKIKSSIQHKLCETRRELARVLIGEAQERTQKFLKKGKLDRRRLFAVLSDDDRIFKKIKPAIKHEVAFQLVIDLSGSMSGQKAVLAVQVACLFAEVLKAINVPFEVIGFNTSSMPSIGDAKGYSRVSDIINFWLFKGFDENWDTVCARLGACADGMRSDIPVGPKLIRDVDGAVGGCNIDHEVILAGASRLWQRPQKRKIQCVLSDGMPSGFGHDYGGQTQAMLVEANNKIVRSGIEQVGFGIIYDQVKDYYSKCYSIKSLDELGPQALSFLGTSMRNHVMSVPEIRK